jgi:hypothetical protein
VEAGVYTGFSVGGSYERRWSDFTQPGVTRYTAKPTEISIVDAPCIPSATFQVIKADGLIEERQFKPGTGNLLKLDEEGDMEKIDTPTIESNDIPVAEIPVAEEGGLVNKLDAIKSLATDLLKAIDTLQKADIPAAPEEIASIPLPSGVGPDYEVEHMPEPNATMALEMDGQPAQEVLAAHTVVTKDLSAAFDAWLPKVGLMFKAEIAEAIKAITKSDSSNPAGQKIAVTNRNIKVTRKEN